MLDDTHATQPSLGNTPLAIENKTAKSVNGFHQCNGIALALGGGAARGWAHIGVLRAFDEAEIPISMIAGTSIGALVGGCYLAGKLGQLETFACSLTKRNILRYMDFTFNGGGLISGERLARQMSLHLEGINMADLDAPFVSVATDIRSGHEIWLHDGPVVSAIRASYALPGIFRPVRRNGRLLVDGALVNPVPVSVCRAWEPDAVIAVNLNAEVYGRGTVIREKYSGCSAIEIVETNTDEGSYRWMPFFGRGEPVTDNDSRFGTMNVMIEAFNIIQDRIARSRLAGDPPDLTIRPKLLQIGMTEFHRAEEAIEIGYEEGRVAAAGLAKHLQLAEM